jgi:putative ABC transport system substrate-binding protein
VHRTDEVIEMKRRTFVTLLGSVATAGIIRPAHTAPPPGKVVRIGVLGTAPWPPFEGLREGLRELGYVEGRNVTYEFRWNRGRNDLYPALAAELAALPVDLIFTIATPAALAARNATSTIPIIGAPVADPVKSALAESMARPGGNFTGFTNLAPTVVAMRLELLKELVPSLSRIVVLANTTNPYTEFELEHLRPSSAALGVTFDVIGASNGEQLDRALRSIDDTRPNGVFVVNDQFLLSSRDRIAAAMASSKTPAVYGFREYVDIGGLLYYGANYPLEFRRMAEYADKILNGTKAGDMPIQMVTKFEMVLNAKAAKALGLIIRDRTLALADEVIE